jgi:regulatory protein
VADRLKDSEAAWQYALRLLAAHDRSELEVRQRLAARAASPATIGATIARLRDLHYLDDTRFARGTAERAVRRGHGSEWVRAELAAKGVTSALIDEVVAGAYANEAALARSVLARRFATPPAHATERAKAARFLLQRGFPEAIVLRVLGEA